MIKKPIKPVLIEAGEQLTKNVLSMGESIITAKELFSDIKPMSDEELEKRKKEEEENKRIMGRNIEEELRQLREKDKRAEEEKKKIQDEEERRRAEEQQQVEEMVEMPSGKGKGKKKRGGAFIPMEKKTQTAEYSKKPD